MFQGLREGGQAGDMPDIFEHLFGGGGMGGMGGMGGFFGMPFGGMGGMGGMGMSGMGGGRGGRRRPAKGEDTLHPLKYVGVFSLIFLRILGGRYSEVTFY